MGLFSIDIERFYQELNEKGKQLKGIACIQYPVYCIHANITDVTPDPLDNLDKVIVDFLRVKSDFNSFQIAALLGTSKALVEIRLTKLIQDALLIKDGTHYSLTDVAVNVFQNQTMVRQHKRSYDFYLDGISLSPLPNIYYSYYRSKFISENDSYHYTTSLGETKVVKPFGPDLVHTPVNKSTIVENIFKIDDSERDSYCIPKSLISIDDIAYTNMSLQLLISVSSVGDEFTKEIIDGFAIYSITDGISYYETLKRNIRIFENYLNDKITNLEFKILILKPREDKREQPRAVLLTNWPEIDKYQNSKNKCFSFSSEDLVKVVEQIFEIKYVAPESIINCDTSIEINIDTKILLESSNRQKLIADLKRERDYKLGNFENNVFLLYLYYKTNDDFVKEVISFKRTIDKLKQSGKIDLKLIRTECPEYLETYRELLVASGEYEVLERLDIEKYMIELN